MRNESSFLEKEKYIGCLSLPSAKHTNKERNHLIKDYRALYSMTCSQCLFSFFGAILL